jgi:hypothetical protein
MLSIVRSLGDGTHQERLCFSSAPIEMVPFAHYEIGRDGVVDVAVIAACNIGVVGAKI